MEIAGAGHREDRKGQRHRDRKARGKGIGTRRCEGADGLTHRERAVDLRSLGPVNWSLVCVTRRPGTPVLLVYLSIVMCV